jgi:hypothetical protein
MPAKRAIFSINETILNDFNRSVPLQQRSKVVERLMKAHVQMADANYRELMEDAALLAGETAARLPSHRLDA